MRVASVPLKKDREREKSQLRQSGLWKTHGSCSPVRGVGEVCSKVKCVIFRDFEEETATLGRGHFRLQQYLSLAPPQKKQLNTSNNVFMSSIPINMESISQAKYDTRDVEMFATWRTDQLVVVYTVQWRLAAFPERCWSPLRSLGRGWRNRRWV